MKRSYLIAAAVAIGVAGWIISGQMNGAHQPPAPDPQPVQRRGLQIDVPLVHGLEVHRPAVPECGPDLEGAPAGG